MLTSKSPIGKWPAIIGIIIGSAIIISILACCFRCLCCGLSFCPCGRRRSKRSKYPSGSSPFISAPYQGYQPANNPHGHTQPQFAQFDVSSNNKVHEDSLPAMPSWETTSQKRVLQEEERHNDVEMGKLEQKAPMLAHQAPSPNTSYAEIGSEIPYQQHGAKQGGDLGVPYTQGQSYNAPNTYTPYAPSSVSIRYEPSSVHGEQETGTAYHSQSYDAQPPSILQAGRKPGTPF